MILILTCGIAAGQAQNGNPAGKNNGGFAGILNDQQKEMLKQRAAKQQEFRKAFRATISQAQKDMLGDPRLMPYERKKEFRASLTDQQVNMIKSHRTEIQKMRQDFRATLTPDQKSAMKKMYFARKRWSHPGRRFNF